MGDVAKKAHNSPARASLQLGHIWIKAGDLIV